MSSFLGVRIPRAGGAHRRPAPGEENPDALRPGRSPRERVPLTGTPAEVYRHATIVLAPRRGIVRPDARTVGG